MKFFYILKKNSKNTLKYLLTTFFIFTVLLILQYVFINIDFLNPVQTALSDFDSFDLYFSQIKPKKFSDDIIIIDISKSDRYEIGEIVEKLRKYNPKVIAIDAFFRTIKDSVKDLKLSEIFRNPNNLVLVTELNYSYGDSSKYDTIKYSDPLFTINSHHGFANLPNKSEKGYRTIRDFYPFYKIKDSVIPSFSAKIVELFNTEKYKKLMDRNNSEEIINYIGNIDRPFPAFICLTKDEFFNETFDETLLTNKIVLLGVAVKDNKNQRIVDDLFFTPMNERFAGKTIPDIYGIVIHANIISMILEERYINTMPFIINVVFSFIICFFIIALFYKLKDNKRTGIIYGALSKMIALLVIILVFNIFIVLFALFHYKIESTIILVTVALASDLLEVFELIYNKFNDLIFRILKK